MIHMIVLYTAYVCIDWIYGIHCCLEEHELTPSFTNNGKTMIKPSYIGQPRCASLESMAEIRRKITTLKTMIIMRSPNRKLWQSSVT